MWVHFTKMILIVIVITSLRAPIPTPHAPSAAVVHHSVCYGFTETTDVRQSDPRQLTRHDCPRSSTSMPIGTVRSVGRSASTTQSTLHIAPRHTLSQTQHSNTGLRCASRFIDRLTRGCTSLHGQSPPADLAEADVGSHVHERRVVVLLRRDVFQVGVKGRRELLAQQVGLLVPLRARHPRTADQTACPLPLEPLGPRQGRPVPVPVQGRVPGVQRMN